MHRACFLSFIGLLATMMVTRAEARDLGRPTDGLRTVCTADYVRFCPDIDPHGSEIEACFLKNIDNVSPKCRAAVAEYKLTPPSNRSRAVRHEP
ncbi:hypothetical protein [Methylobacterium komagatae]